VGERILLCKRNQPVAESSLLPDLPARPRPIGLAKGTFVVTPSFYDALPNEVVEGFEGKSA
jgi:hypothetical protein